MFSTLKKPYPFTGNIKRYFISNFFIGCFVALFLIVFQPFGTAFWETDNKTLKRAGFGLVSFIIPSFLNIFVILFISGKSGEDKWNVWKEILSIVVILCFIAMGNLVYGKLLGIMPLTLKAYFGALLTTCLIGVFPVTAHVLFKQKRLQKVNEEEAGKINEQLKTRELFQETIIPVTGEKEIALDEEKIDPPAQLALLAENGKDKLMLAPDELICIAAADNYSTIYYLEKGLKKKMLIRSSLKRLESQISGKKIIR